MDCFLKLINFLQLNNFQTCQDLVPLKHHHQQQNPPQLPRQRDKSMNTLNLQKSPSPQVKPITFMVLLLTLHSHTKSQLTSMYALSKSLTPPFTQGVASQQIMTTLLLLFMLNVLKISQLQTKLVILFVFTELI